MKYKHDFAWGDTRGIREIMISHAGLLLNKKMEWDKCGYPPHEGESVLIDSLNVLIKNLTGNKYKYILVTNGATNGLNSYIYAQKDYNTNILNTNRLYFGFYPGIAKLHGLNHSPTDDVFAIKNHSLAIIDSPSNPLGKLYGLETKKTGFGTVWDAAYYTPTYCGVLDGGTLRNMKIQPKHDAMVGSLNKLTGLNGLRIGWLATNHKYIYDKALEYVTNDLCGVSYSNQILASDIITNIDLDKFYKESRNMLDMNRDELSKLNNIFGNQNIPSTGMFALFEVDSSLRNLLIKASVNTMDGHKIGDERDSIRINLANSNKSTKNMVDDILKMDKV